MSHFTRIQTKLVNRECLVLALEDLKLFPQVHETPQPLTGYYGSSQGQSAEIIVQGHIISARADIGFRWNRKASEYVVIYDKYETDTRLGEDFFSNNLMLAYGRRMVLAKAQELTERFGECNITESTSGDVQTLRLTFAAHQHLQQHYVRR